MEETFYDLLTLSIQSSDTNCVDQRQFLLLRNAFSCPEEDELMANNRSGGGSRVRHIRFKQIQSHFLKKKVFYLFGFCLCFLFVRLWVVFGFFVCE